MPNTKETYKKFMNTTWNWVAMNYVQGLFEHVS